MTRSEANGLVNLSRSGVIETPTGVDVFSFVAGAGPLTLTAVPSNWSGNVDLGFELKDASGKTLATANTPDRLDASLSTKLMAAGTYYLFVKGAGKGTPQVGGYSNYGSIGQYSIVGTAALKAKGGSLDSSPARGDLQQPGFGLGLRRTQQVIDVSDARR